MKIAILGAGAYGIALAKTLYKNENKVVIWSKFQEEADVILLKRENPAVLPGVKIPEEIGITTDLGKAVESAKIIILAVPMNAVRITSRELSNFLTPEQTICVVSKGIEQNSNLLMSEVVYEETESEKICMVSGPSFAEELVKENEIGFVVASKDIESQMVMKVSLENENVCVSVTNDIRGVQIAASAKNVFAIFMGMLNELNKSESTKAAVMANICNDLRIIISILGGRPDTIYSYAGIGDMLLTCMSPKSRNYTFGRYIAKGMGVEDALAVMNTKTVEGLYTLDALYKLLKQKEVEINSITILYDVIYKNEKIDKILKRTARR